jgi:hypothetical protein
MKYLLNKKPNSPTISLGCIKSAFVILNTNQVLLFYVIDEFAPIRYLHISNDEHHPGVGTTIFRI